jgi:hypothetical protein
MDRIEINFENEVVFMSGGIQPGMIATDGVAAKIDKQCRVISRQLFSDIDHNKLEYYFKLKQENIPGGVGACAPDGGVWFYDGNLIAAFEAKKQGIHGNAIERWFKNNTICRMINPNVSYVTFAVGPGAAENEVISRCLNIVHVPPYGLFDSYKHNGNMCFRSVNGFTNHEIYHIMRETIMYQIRRYDVKVKK